MAHRSVVIVAAGGRDLVWPLELTTAIGQLAEQLEADDEAARAQALSEHEGALLAEEGNKAGKQITSARRSWRFPPQSSPPSRHHAMTVAALPPRHQSPSGSSTHRPLLDREGCGTGHGIDVDLGPRGTRPRFRRRIPAGSRPAPSG